MRSAGERDERFFLSRRPITRIRVFAMEESELIAGLRAGAHEAFTELVRDYSKRLYRVALRLSGNPSDAEEILQDTFVQLHRKLEGFRGESKLSTWLYRIAVNAALMHRPKRAPERALEERLPRFDASGTWERLDVDYSRPARADELLEKRQLAAAALTALDELPDLYRVPFVLRDLEGLETDEVASLLDLDVVLVRQRLHRARVFLRAHLEKLIGGEP
jgi:RNA polymerase sigma-70 factor (ECF subfamily)